MPSDRAEATGIPGATPPRVVLASTSPRRLDLLQACGLDPVVIACEIDEDPLEGESPKSMVERLARGKALAVWEQTEGLGHSILIAADTTIDLDGEPVGKPVDADDAARTLARLSGRSHLVHTGVAMLAEPSPDSDQPVCRAVVDTTLVHFASLSDDDIAWYVATGEPMGKAGSYTIQGLGSVFISGIEGSYHNVVGLPVAALDGLARSLGWPLRQMAPRPSGVAA